MSIQRKSNNVVSSDTLAAMSDNELQYRANRLFQDLGYAGSEERRTAIEIELAYCQREIAIRMRTYDLHAEYIAAQTAGEGDETIVVHA